MRVKKFWFHKLPEKLEDDIVVVDAYAATANLCVLLSKKPQYLIVVNERNLEKAESLYQNSILVGESEQLPPSRFAASNQLKDIRRVRVDGRKVLWMSINGSRLVEKVMKARSKGEVVAGSFSNMKAIASYFLRKREVVNIVMAGDRGVRVEEDRICGEIIEKTILGLPVDWKREKKKVVKFVKDYYDDWKGNLEFLVDCPNEFDIVPKFFVNSRGFIEVKD